MQFTHSPLITALTLAALGLPDMSFASREEMVIDREPRSALS
jgi:hypothetical protein